MHDEPVFEFVVAYGWGADPLEQQFRDMGIQVDGGVARRAATWQKLADAIMLLVLHGYLRPTAAMKMRNDLAADMEKWLVDHGCLVAV